MVAEVGRCSGVVLGDEPVLVGRRFTVAVLDDGRPFEVTDAAPGVGLASGVLTS
jgi:hypothetical protein